MSLRLMKIHMHNDLLFSILCPRLKSEQDRLIKILHNYTTKVIEDRREVLKNKLQKIPTNEETHEFNDIGLKNRMALLDVLLQSNVNGEPLSNEDILEEVETFMFEGHDTTTSAICFALYSIARNPRVQQKMYQEIRELLGNDLNRNISLHDLNNLNYLECVIKETLRIYPSVAIIGREIREDFKYSKYSFLTSLFTY